MADEERKALDTLIVTQRRVIRRQKREIEELRAAVAALTAPYDPPRAATSVLLDGPGEQSGKTLSDLLRN